jgi:hypothetical protein
MKKCPILKMFIFQKVAIQKSSDLKNPYEKTDLPRTTPVACIGPIA